MEETNTAAAAATDTLSEMDLDRTTRIDEKTEEDNPGNHPQNDLNIDNNNNNINITATTDIKMKQPMEEEAEREEEKEENSNPENDHQDLIPVITLLASATTAIHSFLTQNDLILHPTQTLILESEISSVSKKLENIHKYLISKNPIPQTLNEETIQNQDPDYLPLPRPRCWFLRFIASTASCGKNDPRWPECFGMSKTSFNLLEDTLTPTLQKTASALVMPVNYILGIALYRLAHGAPYKATGRRFGVDSATACRAFYEVCKAVNDKLGHMFEFGGDIKRIVEGFGWVSLTNCCGVLGFSKFGDRDDASLIVQALVDSEGRFLDVSAGWPSRMSPAEIFPKSMLFKRVEEDKELLNGPVKKLRDDGSVAQYVIGENWCPSLDWVVTPYPVQVPVEENKDEVMMPEKAFNHVHKEGMEFVKTAFKRVRLRWGLLSMKWEGRNVEFFPFAVMTGCLLHNFLTKCSEMVPFDTKDEIQAGGFPVYEGKANENAERIRGALALQLCPKPESQCILELYRL